MWLGEPLYVWLLRLRVFLVLERDCLELLDSLSLELELELELELLLLLLLEVVLGVPLEVLSVPDVDGVVSPELLPELEMSLSCSLSGSLSEVPDGGLS